MRRPQTLRDVLVRAAAVPCGVMVGVLCGWLVALLAGSPVDALLVGVLA